MVLQSNKKKMPLKVRVIEACGQQTPSMIPIIPAFPCPTKDPTYNPLVLKCG